MFADGRRLSDETEGHKLLQNMKVRPKGFSALITQWGDREVLLEPFDKPLVAQQVERGENMRWNLLFPYGWRESFSLDQLCVDAWDRFHGLTERGLPFVLSRKAQAELFQLVDELTDESIVVNKKDIPVPDFYLPREDIENEAFWTSKYTAPSAPPWDLNQHHPGLEAILPQIKLLKSRVVNFGSGRGHDAAFFAQKGHVVTGVDLSEQATQQAQAQYGHIKNLEYKTGDVFQGDWGKYDLCFEHTLFCAIPPEKRKSLVRLWSRSLDQEGFLLAVFFVMPQRGGPPYGASEWEIQQLLEKHFRLLYWKRWQGKEPSDRLGAELVVYAQKKETT